MATGMRPMMSAPPKPTVAVAASTRNDEDHMARALNRLIGTDPAVVQQVLGTLRAAPARTAQTPQSASAAP